MWDRRTLLVIVALVSAPAAATAQSNPTAKQFRDWLAIGSFTKWDCGIEGGKARTALRKTIGGPLILWLNSGDEFRGITASVDKAGRTWYQVQTYKRKIGWVSANAVYCNRIPHAEN